ncbi:hypothetical protein TD95_003240 [Thielaviopsis punctulata]|uniref:HAD superfamily phosphatase n=1 Tax=Thielaviopsis punctulata TaxID=72032 RepID=A0A0F4ZCI9_9PEZI|nr:hypothetical protein TD95_003240 [Thielaviopsis punctulata]
MNLNLSATLNIWKLFTRPSLCLPHHVVPTFADLPIPLDAPLNANGKRADIRAVVLDKDDCFAYPEENTVYPSYEKHFDRLKAAYPGRKLLIVSNTAGASSYDPQLRLAADVESATGVTVLAHATKKPGCGDEIMAYFAAHPETGVTRPEQIAVVGDRLSTDIMLANKMGGWGFWIRRGVVEDERKSLFSRAERPLYDFLAKRGLAAPEVKSPFE